MHVPWPIPGTHQRPLPRGTQTEMYTFAHQTHARSQLHLLIIITEMITGVWSKKSWWSPTVEHGDWKEGRSSHNNVDPLWHGRSQAPTKLTRYTYQLTFETSPTSLWWLRSGQLLSSGRRRWRSRMGLLGIACRGIFSLLKLTNLN